MSLVAEFVSGLALWVISVIVLPLALAFAVYVYVEGVPEVNIYFQRFVGDPLRHVAASIASVLANVFSVDVVKHVVEVFPVLCYVAVAYLIVVAECEHAFIVAAIAAFFQRCVLPLKENETWPDRWSAVIYFYGIGTFALVARVADAQTPLLTLGMVTTLGFLTYTASNAVGTMSADSGRGGRSGRAAVFELHPRPLLFGAAVLGLAFGKGSREGAFVLSMVFAVVEISNVNNEEWLPTVSLGALGTLVLALEAAWQGEASVALVATMLGVGPVGHYLFYLKP